MEICLWCSTERDKVVELLEKYANGHLGTKRLKTATDDLNNCADCVLEYHLARPQVPHLHKVLWSLENARLLEYFSQDDLYLVEDDQEKLVPKTTFEDFEGDLPVPLMEILQYPYLLANVELSDKCLYCLCHIELNERSEKYKGIYLLLVHPHEEVRSWAIKTVKMLGRLSQDDFYDVQEVLDCMFLVLELGFSFPVEDPEPLAVCHGKLVCMPKHLYDHNNVKNYWLGICMLLTELDTNTMKLLLLGADKQPNILQCIYHTFEGDGSVFDSRSDPFWPVLQCFVVILDRLGDIIWAYTEPIKAFDKIALSSSYTEAINDIISNSRTNVKTEIEDEHLVTCSQMVYETFPQQKQSQSPWASRSDGFDKQMDVRIASLDCLLKSDPWKQMQLHNNTFLWFIPFVQSVIKMSDTGLQCIRSVLSFLRSQVNRWVNGRAACDKVTVFFAHVMAHVVEMLVSEERIDILHDTTDLWVLVIVKGTLFSDLDLLGSASFMRPSDQKPLTSRSNTSHLSSACFKIIRLILKKGSTQNDKHPHALSFLNLLNEHQRKRKELTLTDAQQRELQQCLRTVVGALKGKAPLPPLPPFSALPTPPAESAGMESPFAANVSLASIKVEPLSEPQMLNFPPIESNDPKYPVSVKEEPVAQPQKLMPDPGKLKVIRSCLNERLPKIQAIAHSTSDQQEGVSSLISSKDDISCGSSQPSTSYHEQTSVWPNEDEDNEPLAAIQQRLIQKKSNKELSIIVISDDDASFTSSGESSDLALQVKVKHELEDEVESSGKAFDGDLSESQVFEFETQEDVASAWAHDHIEVAPKKASLKVPLSIGSEDKKCSLPSSTTLSKTSKPPPPIIEAQPLRKKHSRSARPALQDIDVDPRKKKRVKKKHLEAISSSIPAKRRITATESACHIAQEADNKKVTCPGGQVWLEKARPRIVPLKKDRKKPEPESTAERLGLKKMKRMAFDLSQRSLDHVNMLRTHGQMVGKDGVQKPRFTSGQKVKAKAKNLKLLASNERQFFRQSKDLIKKVTMTSPTKPSSPLSPPRPGIIQQKKKKEDEHPQPSLSNSNQQLEGNANDETHTEFNHNWNLTLIDPADMDLCSQMESFNVENVDGGGGNDDDDDQSIFLTQRDPVDMDICEEEPSSPVSTSTENQTRGPSLPPPVLQTPVPQSSSPLHNMDDPLFLKPGMSPMTQKKARPSTTKIYTPSSRSDTLVKDMEAPRTLKSKMTHQALMPPPTAPPPKRPPTCPPVFRQPPVPRPISRLEPLPQLSSARVPQQVPTYKTYPRPEAPTSSRPPIARPVMGVSVLKARIVQWEYKWFHEYRINPTPQALCDKPQKEVPETFRSFEDYYNTLFPLLLTNTFEELAKDWDEQRSKVKLKLSVESFDYGSLDTGLLKVCNANFIANLTPQQEQQQLYPKDDDVVILWLPSHPGAQGDHLYRSEGHQMETCKPWFGVVARSNIVSAGVKRELKVRVQTRGDVSSINKELVQCDVVGSMLSASRELLALSQIKDKPIMNILLAPAERLSCFSPPEPLQDFDLRSKFPDCDDDQAKAVHSVVSMVTGEQGTPKVCMIQGPPGTGKSNTIVKILYQLVQQLGGADPTRQDHLRALVCAPSNAAVDTLMKKIIKFFKERAKGKNTGNCGDINLVRLGSESTICPQVVGFSLDRSTRHKEEKSFKELEQKIAMTEESHQNLLSMRAANRDPSRIQELEFKTEKLNQELQRLHSEKKLCKSNKQNTQRSLILDANVICCTLSSSGSRILQAAFRRGVRMPFNCVIIDEAGQAKETESLIPLHFRCPSLVLVGDPEQLPPTVISQSAKELKFDQSLMARLYRGIRRQTPSRIHFLSQQYRMHPEICSFPSKYIYNNLLKTDRATAEERLKSERACEAYRVFDVMDGQEYPENKMSYFNLKEVKLTVELVRLISEENQCRLASQSLRLVIGVITPYNGQKARIQDALKREFPRVVVDTVDGFQGREVDCVIVSCVRANMGSLGFVGNRHRMNVTITRAKYSLFILGHLTTLREHTDWRALIEDAENRGTVIRTKEEDFKRDSRKILKHSSHSRWDQQSHPIDRPMLHRSSSIPPNPPRPSSSTASSRPLPTDGSSSHRDPRITQGASSRAAPASSMGHRWPRDPRQPTRRASADDQSTHQRNRDGRERDRTHPRDPRAQNSRHGSSVVHSTSRHPTSFSSTHSRSNSHHTPTVSSRTNRR